MLAPQVLPDAELGVGGRGGGGDQVGADLTSVKKPWSTESSTSVFLSSAPALFLTVTLCVYGRPGVILPSSIAVLGAEGEVGDAQVDEVDGEVGDLGAR